MRFSTAIVALFAAGAIAAPVQRRDQELDVTVITQVDYVDPEGDLLKVVMETSISKVDVAAAQSTLQPQAQPHAPANSPAANQAAPSPSPAAPVVSPVVSPAASPVTTSSAVPVSTSSSTPAAQASPGSNLQSSPQSLSQSSLSGAAGVHSYVSAFADNAVSTTTGWVDPSSSTFADICVYHHNVHRLNHTVSLVEWDEDMASAAQAWSEKCVSEEIVPEGSGWGMNVAFSSSTDFNPSDWITGLWYNSELGNYPAYNQGNLDTSGSQFDSWGHYSQVVWPGVVKIGCGVYNGCGGSFASHSGCFYYVAGNIIGEFNKVPTPDGGPIVYPNGQHSM